METAVKSILAKLMHFLKAPNQEKRIMVRYRILQTRNNWLPRLPLPVRTSWGAWWLAWNDVMGKQVFMHDYREQGEQEFLLHFLQSGMTVLDIGAHQGNHTLLFSSQVGSEGLVVAFEPSPRELQRLKLHLAINRCRNVRVEPVAVGNNEVTEELFVCLGVETGCNSLRPPSVDDPIQKIEVPVITIDKYLEINEISKVDFVKIDIEGAELDALRGAAEMVDGLKPSFLCELADMRTEPWGYHARDIYSFLQDRGYRWFSITQDGSVTPCPYKETFHDNLVAVHEERLGLVNNLISG